MYHSDFNLCNELHLHTCLITLSVLIRNNTYTISWILQKFASKEQTINLNTYFRIIHLNDSLIYGKETCLNKCISLAY